jgi:hypothetical protein
VYVVGGVFSRAEGFTNLGGLVGALAFHAVTMALGAFLVGKVAKVKQAA